jgi:hypothetical protein
MVKFVYKTNTMARPKQSPELKFEMAFIDLVDAIHLYYITSTNSKRVKFVKYLGERFHKAEFTLIKDTRIDEIEKLFDKLISITTQMLGSDDTNLKKFGRTGMKRVEKQVDSLVYHYHRMNELLAKAK